jgi:uncharacterized membrane protein
MLMSADGTDSATLANDGDEPSTERLVALSDGVVAIALTLLILGIQVPSPEGLRDPDSMSVLAGALAKTVDGWISYAISFYVIAKFWLIHRRVFRGIRRHAEGVAFWNFLFLFTISVMPFTSELVGKWADNPLSVIIFSLNLILANAATYGLLAFSRRRGLLTAQGTGVLERYRSLEGMISMAFYVLAIPVALISPAVGKLCWAGLIFASRIAAGITKYRDGRHAA